MILALRTFFQVPVGDHLLAALRFRRYFGRVLARDATGGRRFWQDHRRIRLCIERFDSAVPPGPLKDLGMFSTERSVEAERRSSGRVVKETFLLFVVVEIIVLVVLVVVLLRRSRTTSRLTMAKPPSRQEPT